MRNKNKFWVNMRLKNKLRLWKSIMCFLLLVLTINANSQPVLYSVTPRLGNNQMVLKWTSVTGAQNYAWSYRVNSGSWSAWDTSLGIKTSVTINLTNPGTNLLSFQISARTAKGWANSNVRSQRYGEYWPVLDSSGTTPSRGLLHNFCQPIFVNYSGNTGPYLHEGVDINGQFYYPDEKVRLSHGAIMFKKGSSTSGKYVNWQISLDGNTEFLQYGHLKDLVGWLSWDFSFEASDDYGKIDHSIWNRYCSHTHFHRWYDTNNMVSSSENPLATFSADEDKDPSSYNPDIKNTNSDAYDFRFRQANSYTYLPDNLIGYNAVDIVWEAADRMSVGGFYQMPKSIKYYIQKKSGGTYVDAVKSSAAPYILYDNVNRLYTKFLLYEPQFLDALIDRNLKLKSIPQTTQKPAYVFDQWFTWVITNTKGTSGTRTDLDTTQCWATNARNSVTEANGYKPNYDKARSIDEAKFPDGEYKVAIKLADFVHSVDKYKEVKIDNFKPYISKVTISYGSTKFYEAEWKWNTSTAALDYSLIQDNFAKCNQDLTVYIATSESMKEVKISVPGISFEETKTTASDADGKMWKFVIPVKNVWKYTLSKNIIHITGKDKTDNEVLGFLNTTSFAETNIPKRQIDGTWSPNTAARADIVHYIKFDTLRVGISKTDITCFGNNDGTATAKPFNGTAPYDYLWTFQGQQGQTCTELPAGYVKVTVYDKFDCKGYEDTTITEPDQINVDIQGGPIIIPFCIQDGPPSVTLTAYASGGKAPYAYSWPNGSLTVSASGIYTVEVTDANGCKQQASTFVWFISILCSRDPNDITGPEGYGSQQFVNKTQTMPYMIRFENDPDFASAPAQKVIVTMPFDSKHDMYSFKLAEFGFGDYTFQVPKNKSNYSTRLDVKDSLKIYVDFIGGIDPVKKQAFWIFESVSPSSGLPPNDPNLGFLLINDSTHRGEGFASFLISPKSTLATGDSIKAQAKIVFDIHEPIYTNVWFNIADAKSPTSKMDSIPPTIDSVNILLSWEGNDDTKGSGVASYDLYYAINGGSFSLCKKEIKDTAYVFTGSFGTSYGFYTRARDHVGNIETAKTKADRTIRILPNSMIKKPDASSSICLNSENNITWKSIEVNYLTFKYSYDSGHTFHLLGQGIDATDLSYTFKFSDTLPGGKYYRIVAFNAQNNSSIDSSQYFFVRKIPTVSAGTDKNLCLGKTVTIGGSPTASGTSSPYYYGWLPVTGLDDDSVSNPKANPSVNTSYIVTVTDTFGCRASDTVDIFSKPIPSLSFSINNASQCIDGNQFTFINSSTLSSGSFTKKWTLGDTSFATSDTVNHQYTSKGSYNVKLVITSDFQCADSLSKTVDVNPMPIAGYTVNDSGQCLTGNSFSFTNTSSVSSGSLSYLWTFNNSDTSTKANPGISYSNPGTYPVKLKVTTNKGCVDSIEGEVRVYPMPVPTFSIDDNTQCLTGNKFNLTDKTTISSGSLQFLWKFGNNTTSGSQNPSVSYSSDDTFTIRLITTSNFSCVDSISNDVIVYPMPDAIFTINDTSQCKTGNSFVFTNKSKINSGSMSYLWNFGNSTTSTNVNPTQTYTNTGNYIVKLLTSSGYGCLDSATASIHVRPMPTADFSIANNSQCLKNNTFIFYDSSKISSGYLTYLWNFGDNATSTTQNTSHSYSTDDSFSVKLIVKSDFNCLDSIAKTLVVRPMPKADFSVNDTGQCLAGNSFVFTNKSNISSGSLSHSWNFGDKSTSTTTSPAKSYSNDNDYPVTLYSTSAFGCSDSLRKYISVHPMPYPSFTVNDSTQCFKGHNFIFNNTTFLIKGTYTSSWAFGDMSSSTTNSPSHKYSLEDTFLVRLITETNNYCLDSFDHLVIAYPTPNLKLSVNDTTQCLKGNSFVFTNLSSISSGSISYQWQFGDSKTSALNSPTHTYSADGSYQLIIIGNSALGCSDSIQMTTIVYPDPLADFTINDNSQCLNGNNFSFTNKSAISSGQLSYLWQFGDGDTSTTLSPSHKYLKADTLNVRLFVNSALGCSDTLDLPVYIWPSPTSIFSINDSDQCIGGNVFSFTNSSSVSLGTLSYRWQFGDGNQSSLENPFHTYSKIGDYFVKLISTTNLGCSDSSTANTHVNSSTTAAFTVNSLKQCLNGNSFVFTNSSVVTSGTAYYFWDFGDGDTSTLKDPVHSYATFDTFNVSLIASTLKGCNDTTYLQLIVLPSPISNFEIKDSNQCFKHNHFVFSDKSSIAKGTITHKWSFGDGYYSTLSTTSHIYLLHDTFDVKLLVTSDLGCKDSLRKGVIILESPKVAFFINDPAQCLNSNQFTFYNNSSISAGKLSYFWNFGDMGSSTADTAAHIYKTSDTFYVKLIAKSNLGCTDTLSKQVAVFDIPKADFSVNDASQCLKGNQFAFTNLSSVNSDTLNYLWYFNSESDTINSSKLTNPVFSYNAQGSYIVKLVANSGKGCSDTSTQTIVVHPMPTSYFNYNDACLGDTTKFNDLSVIDSTGIITSWSWNFNDGNSSIKQNPNHVYTTAGKYIVSLIVKSTDNCTDSNAHFVWVYPLPSANFSMSYGFNGEVTFTSFSDTLNAYKWDFGDGDTSPAQHPVHKYNANGKYPVTLKVTTPEGCSAMFTDTAKVSNVVGEEELEAERFKFKVFPNPFSSSTNITFELNQEADIRISVYDIYGKEVSIVESSWLMAGRHYYTFGTNEQYATGIYFIKLFVNNKIYVERVIKVILPE